MEVILKEDIANVGKIGEVVRVRDGYARNFLLPRGLVLEANKKNLKTFEHAKKIIADQKSKVLRQAQAVGDELAGVSLVIPMKVGEEGKLFGSVTNMQIEKALKAKGLVVDRRKIHLNETDQGRGRLRCARPVVGGSYGKPQSVGGVRQQRLSDSVIHSNFLIMMGWRIRVPPHFSWRGLVARMHAGNRIQPNRLRSVSENDRHSTPTAILDLASSAAGCLFSLPPFSGVLPGFLLNSSISIR